MLDISIEKFIELHKRGYSLDLLYLLKCVKEEHNIEEMALLSPKIDNLCSALRRKGLIHLDKLTKEGEDLLSFLSSHNAKIVKRKPKNDDFNLFWTIFPATDSFEYKGKKFTGSRAIRISKEDCKTKLHAILNEGEYSIEQIIEAIKLDVYQKKEASYKTGINKLSFLQNSLTYLRQRSYEPYLELIKEGHKAGEENKPISTETYI